MYEKVNPSHPDKLADRIAGALVDWAYSVQDDPKVALEVLLGHGRCWITGEASVEFPRDVLERTVERIAGPLEVEAVIVEQDPHLAANQEGEFRCGDNGIFRGCPVTTEQRFLKNVAEKLHGRFGSDGKYLIDWKKHGRMTICQSNASDDEILDVLGWERLHDLIRIELTVNPLGEWVGGSGVDAGATNRKLGSDMGDAVTGGGLHGKDLSKADVTLNIHAHLEAQRKGERVEMVCSIGDPSVDGIPYSDLVEEAREYVRGLGGFERLAEWGLI